MVFVKWIIAITHCVRMIKIHQIKNYLAEYDIKQKINRMQLIFCKRNYKYF